MKAIIVDDELPAMRMLEMLLNEIPQVKSIKTYLYGEDALSDAGTVLPDIAFLDIHMSGLDGITLAGKINEVSPGTAIVFITAHDSYAVEAFELNAYDYLLKPVRKERLQKAVEKIQKLSAVAGDKARESPTLFVRCFGGFEAKAKTGPVSFSSSKVEELFAYLLLQKGRKSHKTVLLDTLFLSMPEDKALPYLHTCVYQMRKTLKEQAGDEMLQVEYTRGAYLLKGEQVKTDVEVFLEAAEEGMKTGNLKMLDKAVSLYGGELLPQYDTFWSRELDQELVLLMNKVRRSFVQELCRMGRSDEALKYLKLEIKKNAVNEECNELLVDVLCYKGDIRTAKRYYAKYCQQMKEELGIAAFPDFKERVSNFRQEK